MKAGEQIELSFYRYDTQEFVTRSFTVMAVVGKEPDRYGGEIKANTSFIVPDGNTSGTGLGCGWEFCG